jgi:hypothetical protein
MFGLRRTRMITADKALRGRPTAMRVPARHEVLDAPLAPPRGARATAAIRSLRAPNRQAIYPR